MHAYKIFTLSARNFNYVKIDIKYFQQYIPKSKNEGIIKQFYLLPFV